MGANKKIKAPVTRYCDYHSPAPAPTLTLGLSTGGAQRSLSAARVMNLRSSRAQIHSPLRHFAVASATTTCHNPFQVIGQLARIIVGH